MTDMERIATLKHCLLCIMNYDPAVSHPEICYDGFAYHRLSLAYREAAYNGLRNAGFRPKKPVSQSDEILTED